MKTHSTVPVSKHHSALHNSDESCLLNRRINENTGHVLSFNENRRSMAKCFGKKYKTFALDLCDIPESCLPAVLATEGGRNSVVLLEIPDEETLAVVFPDGRESRISRHYLEKIYAGSCALPSPPNSGCGDSSRAVFGQVSNLLADNPAKVTAALAANLLTLVIVLFVMAGYERNISGNIANRPLLIIGAGLTTGLLIYGISGFRLLINRVKWKDGKRQASYPNFTGTNADAVIDLAAMPVFVALSLSVGGLAVTAPLLMGTAFVASHFLRTRLLQSLLVFPRIWAGPFQCLIFLTTLMSVWLVSGSSELTLGGLISSLIIASVCMERVARTAGFARNFRIALMESPPVSQRHEKAFELPGKDGFTGLTAKNLFYTHPLNGVLGLFEVNFSIEPGEKIGIFGVDGAGKSTLCRILAGAICPEHGKIATTGRIGYLGSETAIVYGTLRSNILLGHGSQVPGYLIENIVRFAGLQKLVEENPLGLEMPVQERGHSLSPLQRQAVCLARVLLHSPDILILDEPANQLSRSDADRFFQIIENYWLERPQHRILISSISSRNETPFTKMDRVLILEGGRIVGKSSPQQFEKIMKVIRDSGQNTRHPLESAACHQLQ